MENNGREGYPALGIDDLVIFFNCGAFFLDPSSGPALSLGLRVSALQPQRTQPSSDQ